MTTSVNQTKPIRLLTSTDNPAKSFLGRFWSWITGSSLTEMHAMDFSDTDKPNETAQKIVQIAKARLATELASEEKIKNSAKQSNPLDCLRCCFISKKDENERLKDEIGHVIAKAKALRISSSKDYDTLKANINIALIEDMTNIIKKSIDIQLSHTYQRIDCHSLTFINNDITNYPENKIKELQQISKSCNEDTKKLINKKITEIETSIRSKINTILSNPNKLGDTGPETSPTHTTLRADNLLKLLGKGPVIVAP